MLTYNLLEFYSYSWSVYGPTVEWIQLQLVELPASFLLAQPVKVVNEVVLEIFFEVVEQGRDEEAEINHWQYIP